MFDSAGLKIERAKQHIRDLNTAFTSFLEAHPHTLAIGSDPQLGALTVQVRFREQIPTALGLILGDAIHNLRVALDHATWELIGLDGGTQDRWTSFITGSNQRDYEAACNGIKTPRADTKQFFVELATYPGGQGKALYDLHLLDNAEKHTIITPLVGVAKMRHVKVVRPDGRVAVTLENCSFGMGPEGIARMMTLGGGMTAEFDENPDPTIDIFFSNVELFGFQPIIPAVMYLKDAVSECVGKFEVFVATRG